jgi:DNA recombination protein Rad52
MTPEAIKELKKPLDPKNVAKRTQSGRQLDYVEGWFAIAEANRIFGHDAWASETVDIRCVAEKPRKIGRDGKDGWGVSYVARVRITVDGVVREGVGAGHGIDADLGLAHESAIKEAETDARKRGLMTFGWPFGLALYDKSRENVASEPAGNPASRGAGAVASPAAPAPANPNLYTKEQQAYLRLALPIAERCDDYHEFVTWWTGEADNRFSAFVVEGTKAYADLIEGLKPIKDRLMTQKQQIVDPV